VRECRPWPIRLLLTSVRLFVGTPAHCMPHLCPGRTPYFGVRSPAVSRSRHSDGLDPEMRSRASLSFADFELLPWNADLQFSDACPSCVHFVPHLVGDSLWKPPLLQRPYFFTGVWVALCFKITSHLVIPGVSVFSSCRSSPPPRPPFACPIQ